MKKTDFDTYLEEQLKDPDFAERFRKADEAWDIALQISQLRRDAGLSQAQLAKKLKTSQQQISRLESANYQSHSLSMLRRVAKALGARVVVSLQPQDPTPQVSEEKASYPRPAKKPRKPPTKSSLRKKRPAAPKSPKPSRKRSPKR